MVNIYKNTRDAAEEYGLNDLVDDAVKGKELLKNRLNINFAEGKNKLDLVMTYTSNYSLTMVPYVNTGLTANGPHISQIKSLITREFNKRFAEKTIFLPRYEGYVANLEENFFGEGYSELLDSYKELSDEYNVMDFLDYTTEIFNMSSQWFQ